jgi:VIT1/CCC1 family predicted Fe2+/Mn2+ transporter
VAAFSMGTGEYVSVTNQNELVHAEVAVERRTPAEMPEAEQGELQNTFSRYGAGDDTAGRMAAAVGAIAVAVTFAVRLIG